VSVLHTTNTVECKREPPSPSQPAVTLAFLPFYHAYCLHFTTLRLYFIPNTTVILPKWNANKMLAAIEKWVPRTTVVDDH
jgi:hypothetical protein